MARIEIFKPGTFTDMSGNRHTFSEADVRTTARVYDPSLLTAVLVTGHPRHDDPSFGDVAALEFDGVLQAETSRVDPAFAEAVNAGRYGRVSASFYAPDAPNNPVPGTFYLRHVGFLGAMAPAVKGLKAPSFGDDGLGVIEFADMSGMDDPKAAQEARAKRYGIGVKERGHVTRPSDASGLDDGEFGDPVNYRYPLDKGRIHSALSYWAQDKNREQYTEAEVKAITRRILAAAKKHAVEVDREKFQFADYEDMLVVRIFRNIKNQLIELVGKDKADQVIDEYALDVLQADAMKEDAAPGTCAACGQPHAECICQASTTEYGEQKGGHMALTQQELEKREKALLDREKALKDEQNTKKHADNVAFAEGLVADGKLLAASKGAVVAVLDFAGGITTGDTIDFGEGDAKKTEAPLETIKSILGSFPKQIEFGELAGGAEFSEAGKKEEYIDVAKLI